MTCSIIYYDSLIKHKVIANVFASQNQILTFLKTRLMIFSDYWVKLLFLLVASFANADENDIVIIESYHSTYQWSIAYRQGILNVLPEYNFITFQMDTKRLPEASFVKRAQLAWDIIQATNPKLIILGDDNALKYLASYIGQSKFNAVYLGINSNPRKTGSYKYKNITGVLERPLYRRSIAEIKKLLPKMKRVLILFDDSITADFAIEEFFQNQKALTIDGVHVQLFQSNILEEWQQTVLEAKSMHYDALWLGLYHTVFDNKQHISEAKILEWVSQKSKVPVLAFWDFSIGKGKAIGGFVMTGESQGQAAGYIAKKILNGTSPSEILPMIPKHGKLIFSQAELKRWNLSLPAEMGFDATLVK